MKTKLNDSKDLRCESEGIFHDSFYRTLKLVSLIGIIFLSFTANAQTTVSVNPVIQAAPHLPKMERATGGKLFYGEKFTYKKEVNEKTLKAWSVNYPSEVATYKTAMTKYLKNTDVSKLSVANQNTFYDLKSQWLMSLQIIN
jgi:hypothetical protein